MRHCTQVQVRFPLSPFIYDVLFTLEVAKQMYNGLPNVARTLMILCIRIDKCYVINKQ